MGEHVAQLPCPHCGGEHAETTLRCPVKDLALPLEGRLIEGKFRFIRQIGKGGMATVWLARNELVDREVAIKIIRPETARSDEMQARFRGEAKAAGRIQHPNVCQILDFGVSAVGPFIVMERLHGANLGEIIERRGPLSPDALLSIVACALEGLHAAHRQGIVHRDLKPENIFLHRPESGSPTVKLMDFGVAKFIDGSGEVETEQGTLLGTPQYMAPEQFQGADRADPRTDIWAMGTVMHRAFTGIDVFKGATIPATLIKVTTEDPEPLEHYRNDIPQSVEALVLRCLEKEPGDRFADATQMKAAIASCGVELRAVPELVVELLDGPRPSRARLPTLPGPSGASGAFPAPGVEPHAMPSSPSLPASPIPASTVVATEDSGRSFVLPLVLIGGLALAFGVWWTVRPRHSDAVEVQIKTAINPSKGNEQGEPELPQPDQRDEPEDERDEAERDASHDDRDEPEPDATQDGDPEPVAVEDDPPSAATEGDANEPEPQPEVVIEQLDDKYAVLIDPRGPVSGHDGARKFCEALNMLRKGERTGWILPNPTVAKRLGRFSEIPAGRYWTSARWRNRVKVVILPKGRLTSKRASSKVARSICVTRELEPTPEPPKTEE